MKKYLLPFILFCSYGLQSQQMGLPSGHYYRSIEAGYTTFRPYGVNYFLFGNDDGSPSFQSLMTFGYCTSGLNLSRGGMGDGAFALNFYYPQELVIKPDTLKYRIGGWELMTSIYALDLLSKVEPVDFVIAPGVYWGSIYLRKYNSTGNFKSNELFKNPFVAPMLRADLRFIVGRLVVGGRWSYRYDITKSRWKKGSSVVLPGYKCEEMQYMVYVGITIAGKRK